MSHQRYLSHDPVKEPHSVSVKVLRLSRPTLVTQYPVEPPLSSATDSKNGSLEASLAYRSKADTNPAPFLLSPILNLPMSFGSAYVGETFSCTLCANNDLAADGANKTIRDVRIEAEMKTPGLGQAQTLSLSPPDSKAKNHNTQQHDDDGDDSTNNDDDDGSSKTTSSSGVDLAPGSTLQKIVSFDLKEEGNHVLAVTVSYYEATETSGRTRTFRKLYQFICKASLIVRTKVGALADDDAHGRRRWVLEAQLENCSEDAMQLGKVVMELEDGFRYRDCNWETLPGGGGEKPVLHPGEVEQVCFVVEEHDVDKVAAATAAGDGRLTFGVLGIGWRGEMGNRGFLSTGKLGTRVAK